MKSTKSALLMSFTSLLLCFAMLIGSTFAWFTDSVTSGVNKIVSGNLDIEVSYFDKTANEWVSIEGAESLFDKNALWEPGHTEYVNLKVENKGNLALNYKMMVSPVTEKGGVNVNGQSFKLSDYLMFGVAESTETGFANREAARAAVPAPSSLNAITKSGTMAKDATAQYVTLVVYMPETVGNEANYKTGTAAPEIELGIKVVATQLQSESDSFDNTYDAGAVSDSFYEVGPAYDYFPQISTTVAKAATGDTQITYAEKLNKGDDTETTLVKATVPAGALEDSVESITVTVKPQEAAAATTTGTALAAEITAGREVANFDVKISGVKSDNTTAIPMEVFVGKGLSNVKVYHKGVLIDGATYDATTGIAKFDATTFSDYSFAYDAVCARIGEKTYGSLALAVADAQSGATVTLLKDCKGDGIVIDKNLTVDLSGKTYTVDGQLVGSAGTATNGFQLLKGNEVTIKNGKIAVGSNVKTGTVNAGNADECRLLLQNFANLTLNNVTLDGTALKDSRAGRVPYVLSNNCGTVDIIGNTSITAPEDGFAFDAYSWPTGGYPEGVTVNVNTTGTITGAIELAGDEEPAKNTVNITNGNFVGSFTVTKGNLSITGGTFSVKPDASFIADGLEAVQSGNVWTIEKEYAAQIGETKYETLQEAVNAAKSGDTVKLLKDVTPALSATSYWGYKYYSIAVEGKENVTIDFNGHTLYGALMIGGQVRGWVQEGSKSGYNASWEASTPSTGIVLTDSSEAKTGGISYGGTSGTSGNCVNVYDGSSATINGGCYYSTYAGLEKTDGTLSTDGQPNVVYVNGGSLVINDGTFESKDSKSGYCRLVRLDDYGNYSATTTVTANGGTFNAHGNYGDVFYGDSTGGTYIVNIYAGTFTTDNIHSYLAELDGTVNEKTGAFTFNQAGGKYRDATVNPVN